MAIDLFAVKREYGFDRHRWYSNMTRKRQTYKNNAKSHSHHLFSTITGESKYRLSRPERPAVPPSESLVFDRRLASEPIIDLLGTWKCPRFHRALPVERAFQAPAVGMSCRYCTLAETIVAVRTKKQRKLLVKLRCSPSIRLIRAALLDTCACERWLCRVPTRQTQQTFRSALCLW